MITVKKRKTIESNYMFAKVGQRQNSRAAMTGSVIFYLTGFGCYVTSFRMGRAMNVTSPPTGERWTE